ncbi:MAG: ABC transporter ATP-binding protein [Tepidisphaeraceae bacterium]
MTAQAMEEDVFTGKIDFALWRKMLRFARPHRRKLFALMTLGAIVSGGDMSLPYLTGRIVDAVTMQGAGAHLSRYMLVYGGVIAGFVACIFSFIMIAGRITVSISYDIRQTCFDKLQRLPFSYYDRKAVGWLMARMTSDCSNLSRVMAWALLDLSWGTSVLAGITIMMLLLAWRLALVVIAIAPVLMLISRYYQVRLLKTSRALRKANSQTTAAFNEGIVGVRTSKSMVREERNSEEFSHLTQAMYTHAVRNALYAAMFWPMMLSVCGIGTALALRFGGLGVIHGEMTLGALATFLQIVFFIQFPVQELTNAITQIQGAQASAERVQSLLDAETEIEDSPEVIERIRNHAANDADSLLAIDGLDARIHSLEFRNVGFAYKAGQTVLREFNLCVQPGQSIALVGPTGGGKTTIVGLACRFYEPTSGQILINGLDYRRRSLKWLQGNLGMVLQQPHLFSGTVRENIRYGRLSATDDEVVQAAKLANAHDFITAMKDGYNASVGEGGNQLSTGQKQLVALARAIIADPQIFVMDEATSSVDTLAERAIQAAIDRILKNRISFVIAHRLSTIKSASRILVIDGGQIIEDGNHHDLIRRGGHYRDLYTNQFMHDREAAVLEHAPNTAV